LAFVTDGLDSPCAGTLGARLTVVHPNNLKLIAELPR